jgi:hypothetical protein
MPIESQAVELPEHPATAGRREERGAADPARLAAPSPITTFHADSKSAGRKLMGTSFFLKVAVLGALALAQGVAHAENDVSDAIDKANRSIVDTQNNTKRALRDTDNKINNNIVNTQNKTKRGVKDATNKVNNSAVDAQHKVKGTVRDNTP